MRSCILLLSLLAVAANAADTVWIKNGDRIVGTVQSKNGDHLVVDTVYAGRISIDWQQIATLETAAPVSVKTRAATSPTLSTLDIADDGYVVCKKCTSALIPLTDIEALIISPAANR